MTPDPDIELLHAWKRGDPSASNALMARYYDRVFRFFDLRVPAAAEDLTQRTFLGCLEGVQRLVSASSFRAFLFGIARYQLLQHYQENRRVRRVSQFADLVSAEPAVTASRVIAIHQEQQLVLRALTELTVDAQIALQLFYFEGMAVAEVAEAVQVSVTTVTTRLSRARHALAKAIEGLHSSPEPRAAVLADLEHWVRSMAELELDVTVRYRG
ncbi:MAG: RNA polymerase sigma factor [Myxococcota bacterium]